MRCFVVVSVRREVDLVHSYGVRRRDVGLDCVDIPCPSLDFVHMSPYRVFFDYFVPSCRFSSMSWVSSSTTACATTLVARAARAAGAVGPAVLALSMSSSRRSMRREISACAGMSSIRKSLNALNTGSLNVPVVSS